MLLPALAPELLAELRAPRTYPAVSVTLPTHRHRPENQQDHIRLRNLVATAEQRLTADPDLAKDVRVKVIQQLKAAVEGLDPEHFLDGLVIYATADEHRHFTLPQAVPERVVLSTTYLTRNVVAASERERSYWAVVLSEAEAKLWRGVNGAVQEVKEHGFPVKAFDRLEPMHRRDSPKGEGEDWRRLVRAADEGLGKALGESKDRVVVVAVAQEAKAFCEHSKHRDAIAHCLEVGGLLDATPAQLSAALAPARESLAAAETAKALKALEDAQGAKRFTSGIQETWALVGEGRVAHLVLEEDYQVTGTIDGEKLVVGEGEDTQDDLVDSLVEAVLEHKGQVTFVGGDWLHGDPVQAVLRY
jgi:hypothetical protein